MFELIVKYKSAFAGGLLVTLQLCLLVWGLGLIIGGILGLQQAKRGRLFTIPMSIMSFVMSGIPILVFLFWMHYPAQSMLGVNINPFYTAALALGIVNIFAVSDIVNKAVRNLPRQYGEVARISGISSQKRFLKVELPLILRHILPPLLISQVTILHLTLFASLISVEEIFRVCQRVISVEYKPVEIYTALGLFFLAVSLPINGIAIILKNKFSRDISER